MLSSNTLILQMIIINQLFLGLCLITITSPASIILMVINIILIVISSVFSDKVPKLRWILYLGIISQMTIDCDQSRIAGIIIIEQQEVFQFMILLAGSVNLIMYNNDLQSYLTLIIALIFTISTFIRQYKQNHKEKESLQQDLQGSPIPDIELQKSKSIRIEESENLQSPVMPVLENEQSREDEDLLQQMAWIHNQSTLAYNQNYNLIYQNFFMGKLLKKEIKVVDYDYEQMFLECKIELGSREVNEMFGMFEEEAQPTSDTFVLNQTNHSRYRIKTVATIRDMVSQLREGYSKWKFFTFIIYRLTHQILDFSGLLIRIIAVEIKDQIYIVFMFDQQPSYIKRVLDEPGQYLNVFSTFLSENNNYMNPMHLYMILCLHENENKINPVFNIYFTEMRLISLRLMIFLQNMRDLTLAIGGQLFLKQSLFEIGDVIEELKMIYNSCLSEKHIELLINNEYDMGLNNDLDRVKQVIKCLFDIFINSSNNIQIGLEIRQYLGQGVSIIIKGIPIGDGDKRSQMSQVLKHTAQLMRTNCKDFDLAGSLELQSSCILAYLLSGTHRKGIEILTEGPLSMSLQMVIDSNPNKSSQNMRPKKYFDTSLSMLLAQQHDGNSSQLRIDESKLNLTQFSRQQSIKEDHSAHFSQLSKIRESPQIRQLSVGKYNKPIKSESANDSKNLTSILDFGDSSNPSLVTPDFQPKFLSAVMKFKLNNRCCSKVLIADSDYSNAHILSLLLKKYGICSDIAFSQTQASTMISGKEICRCKNHSYLLYFIDVHLPGNGIELLKDIRSQFRQSKIDKGFMIATSSLADIDIKLECFNVGVEYFLSKPFDLFELSAILQYLQF